MQYPANATPITVMCSGSMSPQYILTAFRKGADGVLVSGCHIGDCHYLEGNYLARRKLFLVKELLQFVGLEPERFRMSWVSAAEGAKFAKVVADFVSDLRPLGPQHKLKAEQP
jgi:F420-non-reducing hydrogenase iron-sulfur subunit